MGTPVVLASTVRFSPGTNLFLYVAIWVACAAGIGVVAWAALRSNSMVLDGLAIGILRGGPNAFLSDVNFDPYLNAEFATWLQAWNDTWSNALFNGIEAAISAVLARRVAVAVVPSIGIGKTRAAAAGDPFAEPSDPGESDAEPAGTSTVPTKGEPA